MKTRLQKLRRKCMKFRDDVGGNVAIFFAFGAFAVIGTVGIAIDTSVAYNVRSQLASAVDAAALAGARNYASPTRDADIQRYFDANFEAGYMGSVLEPLSITPDDQARTVTVTARANIPTFFMNIFGTDSTDVAATAEATLSSRDVEVALVLDVTGSMDGSRMTSLKAAANELVDIVVQDLQDPFYSKVALVPYSNSVNVGSYATQVRGAITSGGCTYPAAPSCEDFTFTRQSGGSTTFAATTCATERSGTHLSTDAAPSLAPLGTHYHRPDGGYNPCPSATIMPLTSNKTALNSAINGLTAGGSTAGQIGTAWGWYMISPNFAYLFSGEGQPANYGAIHLGQEVLKVVVIMTDGDFNTIYHSGVVANNSTSGSGDDEHKINQAGTNGSAFDQAQALCTAMKAEGVKVYTVGLELATLPAATTFVNNCATDADHVYLPESGTQLRQAFQDIARQVSNLRISM